MVGFLRSDINSINSYIPHPGGKTTQPLDRLDTNESPFDLPLELKEKLCWIYQNQIETNRYPDGSHHALKEAIAFYINQSAQLPAQTITDAHISVGNGSDELIRSLLIATCVGGEGSILVANPTFSMYEILAKTLAIPVLKIDRQEQDWSIDLLQAQKALKEAQNPPIRVVFLVHPNSPTGNILTPAELDWIRNLPEDILVVIDEAYFEYSQTSLVGELLQHPNWVILRTFSKAFRLAAYRVGYAIASVEVIKVLEKVRLPYNLPSLSQAAALMALSHRQQLLNCIPEIQQERERLSQTLAESQNLRLWPSFANFIYLRCHDQNIDLQQFTAKLKQMGTLIRHTGGGLRITVGSQLENTNTLEHFAVLLTQALH